MTDINPHGQVIEFGKHKGTLFTRLPVSYLRWMINVNTPQADIAKAEFERRGDAMPQVELSSHAIDNASLRVLDIWQDREDKSEGFYSWLSRMILEAIDRGTYKEGKTYYQGMKFVIYQGEEFPSLKTIMRDKGHD